MENKIKEEQGEPVVVRKMTPEELQKYSGLTGYKPSMEVGKKRYRNPLAGVTGYGQENRQVLPKK